MPRKLSGQLVQTIEQAQARMAEPVDTDAALQKLGATGKTALARRLTTNAETNPDRAKAFQRIATRLVTLAPGRPRTLQRAVLLYVPDGAYQMQVFALEDSQDNHLVVCCEDVLNTAIAAGVVAPLKGAEYKIGDTPQTLTIERFDGKSENPPPYINSMTGWNRKALRITLPLTLQKAHVDAALMICAISAGSWRTAAAQV